MKAIPLTTLLLFCTAACMHSAYAGRTTSFDRYDVILDRQPFGKPVVKQKESFEPVSCNVPSIGSVYRLFGIVQHDGDLLAGIESLKENRAALLHVGETWEGCRLVSIDTDEDSALFQHEDQQEKLVLERRD